MAYRLDTLLPAAMADISHRSATQDCSAEAKDTGTGLGRYRPRSLAFKSEEKRT